MYRLLGLFGIVTSGNTLDSSANWSRDMFEDEGFVSGPLITVADAARYLGVGKKIVYQLIEGGELNAVRNRGAVWIERRSLDNYKASGKLS